uniref:Protein Wnt n=1 Tax=Papio anubis TaxID=9555 RepID=A0A8I5NCG6_PAPAN
HRANKGGLSGPAGPAGRGRHSGAVSAAPRLIPAPPPLPPRSRGWEPSAARGPGAAAAAGRPETRGACPRPLFPGAPRGLGRLIGASERRGGDPGAGSTTGLGTSGPVAAALGRPWQRRRGARAAPAPHSPPSRRWNWDGHLSTRESAFVHAIASAGVAFAVTRSCAEGTSTICGCDSHHKGPPGEGWKWGGCSEDADFGVLVSREFADARENRPDARSAMNKHNNEAGRTTILDHMHLKCKCHGLSGSCEVKTCWWAQPDFRAIGDFLKDKYDSASEMVVEKHRTGLAMSPPMALMAAICSAVAVATTRGRRSGRKNATASSTGAATSAARSVFASTMCTPASRAPGRWEGVKCVAGQIQRSLMGSRT